MKDLPAYMFLTVEGYLNCGDHTDFWYPLSLCTEDTPLEDGPIELFSRMYAGRGYWIHMPLSENGQEINYLYAPYTSLTCPWDTTIECSADVPF